MKERESELITVVENKIPEFANFVKSTPDASIALHQDAFAADYQKDELSILGMAIKYAGLHGKQVKICGANRETIGGSTEEQENKQQEIVQRIFSEKDKNIVFVVDKKKE